MNLIPIEWKTPQICGDCRDIAAEGWQELKSSAGGPYLEKRCRPCAVKHYGKAALGQIPVKKKGAGNQAGDTEIDLLMERMG